MEYWTVRIPRPRMSIDRRDLLAALWLCILAAIVLALADGAIALWPAVGSMHPYFIAGIIFGGRVEAALRDRHARRDGQLATP